MFKYKNVIENFDSRYKISNINVNAGGNIMLNFDVKDKETDIFFWDMKALYPYSSIKN